MQKKGAVNNYLSKDTSTTIIKLKEDPYLIVLPANFIKSS